VAELSALLFDMDGTLVDTAEANYAAYAAALAEAGVAIARAEFDRHAHGRQWRQFLPEILAARASTADAAAIAARKHALYPAHAARTRLNAQLVALARAAKPRLAIGLVTTASRASVDAVLASHGIADLFDTIVTGDDVASPKPAPEAYLLAATRLGLAPAACLAFEDSDVGAESARRARIPIARVSMA
jgi:HAD superfamily hydrolase (TIGR01509 family)